MNKEIYNLGIECAREVLVNLLGHTNVDDTDVKGKTAYWLLRQASEKEILVMFLEGKVPFGFVENSYDISKLQQDFEDIITINETMLTNRNWDYERMKQFVYDNCNFNPKLFQTIQMSDFEVDDEIIELIDLVEEDEIIKITEPESVTHGELPLKTRSTVRKIAAFIGTVGFILVVAGLFYNCKK